MVVPSQNALVSIHCLAGQASDGAVPLEQVTIGIESSRHCTFLGGGTRSPAIYLR
jgi:hypothetical protein